MFARCDIKMQKIDRNNMKSSSRAVDNDMMLMYTYCK